MKKILLVFPFFAFASNCFAQFIPQFNRQPEVGYQVNLAHPDAQGLVGHWLFNEGLGSTLYDLTPYGNDGTLTLMDPNTDWVVGRDGWALDFDGSDDFVNLGNSDVLSLVNFTQMYWIFNREPTAQTTILCKGDQNSSVSNQFLAVLNSSVSSLRHLLFAGGATDAAVRGISTVPTNIWTHLAITRSGSSIEFYFNGLPDGSETLGPGDPVSGNLVIGRQGTLNRFNGKMSDVLIYDFALNAQQVLSHFVYSYAMFEQPPGRILTAAAVAARSRFIPIF